MIKQMASAFVIVAAVGLSPSAEASVLYEFTAHSSFPITGNATTTASSPQESYTGSFSYLAPSFVIPDVTVPVGDLGSCNAVGSVFGPAACTDQGFLNSLSPGFETIAFGVNSSIFNGSIFYYFNAGTFGTPGTYNTVLFGTDQSGTLIVTDLEAVPEPTSLALLAMSFIAMAAFLRRRSRSGDGIEHRQRQA